MSATALAVKASASAGVHAGFSACASSLRTFSSMSLSTVPSPVCEGRASWSCVRLSCRGSVVEHHRWYRVDCAALFLLVRAADRRPDTGAADVVGIRSETEAVDRTGNVPSRTLLTPLTTLT